MPHPVVMPSFGMYTAEGELATWLEPAGARVVDAMGKVLIPVLWDMRDWVRDSSWQ